jgi:cysteine desulfurase/selenocysteine lyase
MQNHVEASCAHHQEFGDVLRDVARTRGVCAKAIGAHADEIALLGPTSLGLSLFANGLDWKPGDELVCYADDYPSNVYPWTALASARRGDPACPSGVPRPDHARSAWRPR